MGKTTQFDGLSAATSEPWAETLSKRQIWVNEYGHAQKLVSLTNCY